MISKINKLSIFVGVLLIAITAIFLLVNKLEIPKVQAATDQTITDQNGDGIINLVDARILAPPATTSCPVCVDINGDKKIDQKDIDLIRHYINLGNNAYKPKLDVNNDGVLNQADIDIIQNYVGQTVTGPAFGLDNPSELTFGFRANEIIVKFKAGVNTAGKNPIFTKYNLTNDSSLNLVNADRLRTTESNVESLQKQIAQEPGVEKVYKNHVGEWLTNDPQWSNQWAPKKINIEKAWYGETIGNANHPVKVAIIDTGVDVNHPDLQAHISSLKRDASVFSPLDPNYTNVEDIVGHGTFVAGIIGAVVNNQIAVAGLVPNVEIVPVKAGGVDVNEYEIATGFEWAIDQDVKVISMSFGLGYGNDSDYLSHDLLKFARDKGITLVASAGNFIHDDCIYPARDPNVVCVGATKADDSLCDLTDGRKDAKVFAPGDAIVSTYPTNLDSSGIRTSPECVTSWSAPYIAGVAALCHSVQPLGMELTNPHLSCANFATTQFGRVDAWETLWYRNCYKWNFDNSADNKVGVDDVQALLWHYYAGPIGYNKMYDIFPVGGDGKIDDGDVLTILERANLDCPPR